MKEDKISILIACFTGFFGKLFFDIFWENFYPKVGIELNKYVALTGFFLIIVPAAYYFDKRRRLKQLKKPFE